MASILFLLLVGSFYKEGEAVFLEGAWKGFFMWIMFFGVLLIFLNALGWLDDAWGFLGGTSGGTAVGSIILILVIILFMWFVTKGETKEKKSESK